MSSPFFSSSLLLSGVSFPSISISSASNQIFLDVSEYSNSALKRTRTSNFHSAPSFSTSRLTQLPTVLFSEVFSYLYLDERMASQRVCRPINDRIIFHANTHYVLSREFPALDQAALAHCFKKSILNTIKVIDLKGIASDNIIPFLSKKMPALTRLVLPNLMDEVKYKEGEVANILTENCSSLRSLDLRSLDFRGCKLHPNALIKMNLPNLTYLNLAGYSNMTSEDLGAVLERSPYLEELFLDRCSEITPEDIVNLSKKLSRLRKLSLNGCTQITSEAIASLSNCSHLQELYLVNCSDLTENVLSGLVLPDLRILDLSYHDVDDNLGHSLDDSIAFLSANCPKLERLFVKDRSDFDLSLLRLPELVELNLKNFSALDEFERKLTGLAAGCPKLTSLNLSNVESGIDYSFNLSLINFPLLKHLDISGWEGPEEDKGKWRADILAFTAQCPRLESLNLSGHSFSPSDFLPLLSHLGNLKRLDLSYTQFHDGHFFDLVQACPQLQSLILSNQEWNMERVESELPMGVDKFTGDVFASCRLPELVHLDISNCRQISNVAIQHLSNFPKLKYLNLKMERKGSMITSQALMNLRLPELTHLNYAGLEEDDFQLFRLPELTDLNYKDFQIFRNVTEEALKAAKANCPKLKYLVSKKQELGYWDKDKLCWRDFDFI